jgi:ABC-type glycerol-3-phosphate transport system permease component
MAATSSIILFPMFFISYFIQRHFIHGATQGSDR